MAEEPLWKRIVEASKELEKDIPEEVLKKAEAVICKTICVEVNNEEVREGTAESKAEGI